MSKLKINLSKITIKVSKTIQEKSYEPFTVGIEQEIICETKGNIDQEQEIRENLYKKLEEDLDNFINERL